MLDYLPGTRVLVFDARLYTNDTDTPVSRTMQPATVLRWYGTVRCAITKDLTLGPYSSLIDVRFDRDGKESRAHFTDHVDILSS